MPYLSWSQEFSVMDSAVFCRRKTPTATTPFRQDSPLLTLSASIMPMRRSGKHIVLKWFSCPTRYTVQSAGVVWLDGHYEFWTESSNCLRSMHDAYHQFGVSKLAWVTISFGLAQVRWHKFLQWWHFKDQWTRSCEKNAWLCSLMCNMREWVKN